MNPIKEVGTKVVAEYKKHLTKKLMMIDAFIVFTILTGVMQAAYVVLVGSFPFNSFLSGFLCCVGMFSLSVSLRLQLTSSEFKINPEKAFGDFVFCSLVLFFVVVSFMG
mmetsp:Transcript_10619/g.10695  ORF Transcript_10619/g.10695 Transcript_10619/m.10695 type:complete len:109 (-) Transcript_10619:104-430(-)